jgi:glyoxylase-like metal-dependent hydrolase (beta-lactamase superfamily II)
MNAPSHLPGLTFPFAEPPAPGEVIEVAPGILWHRMPLPFALDHINLWVLKDGLAWTAVDTGIGREEVKDLWPQVAAKSFAEGGLPRLIVTHYHPDHVGLAGWLAQTWGPALWMTRGEYNQARLVRATVGPAEADRRARFYVSHGLDAARAEEIRNRGSHYLRHVTPLPESIRRIRAGDDIEIDGSLWRVMIGTGHAPEHAMLYCGERGILIAGDQVLPKISTNVSVTPDEPLADPIQEFLGSLQPLKDLPADTLVLPSHGLPFRGLRTRIEQLEAHHEARLEDTLKACAEPQTTTDILPVLFRRKLDAHTINFAMGEALAHLNRLVTEGRAKRLHGKDGVWRFQAASARS